MVAFDANESLTPFEHRRDGRPAGYGAILFDARRVQQAQAGWFDPAWWGERASAVSSGGRGGAWFVDAPFGQAVRALGNGEQHPRLFLCGGDTPVHAEARAYRIELALQLLGIRDPAIGCLKGHPHEEAPRFPVGILLAVRDEASAFRQELANRCNDSHTVGADKRQHP